MTEAPISRFRSQLRWVLPVLLVVVLLPSWTLFFSGGMLAVYGWQALVALGQLLAPLTILVLMVHAVRKRRFSRPMWVTLVLALVTLWPGLWGFGVLVMPFPYDLERSVPPATVRLPSNETIRVASVYRINRDATFLGHRLQFRSWERSRLPWSAVEMPVALSRNAGR